MRNNTLPYRTVAWWASTFQRGCTTSRDLKLSGQPVSVQNDVSRAIDQCMESDRRWTLLELQAETGIEKWTIYRTKGRKTFICILVESNPFFMALDLQLSFYCPLCYNSRAHCPLLQCLCTRSAILADAHTYFVVSSFKREGKK